MSKYNTSFCIKHFSVSQALWLIWSPSYRSHSSHFWLTCCWTIMPLTCISNNLPSLVIDVRYNNYDANARDNSSQMLSNYRLNREKSFFLPATHSSFPWNRCVVLCILCCRYASSPACCSSGLNDFHLLIQRMTECSVHSALQVPKRQ